MLKVYVSARYSRLSEAKHLAAKLEDYASCEITLRWWDIVANWKEDDTGLTGRLIAEAEKKAILEADAFVLLWSSDLLGALVEAGIAIASQIPVYVVGADRRCVFWCLDDVMLFDDVNRLVSHFVLKT